MSYSGLVVGGPAAGRDVTCETEFYQVVKPPQLTIQLGDAGQPIELTIKAFRYRWHGLLLGPGDEETGYWVPEWVKDENMVSWVMRELMKSYRSAHAE